jgi:hypothetical protein
MNNPCAYREHLTWNYRERFTWNYRERLYGTTGNAYRRLNECSHVRRKGLQEGNIDI